VFVVYKFVQEYGNMTFTRITKSRARRLYDGGATIALAPVWARFGGWIAPAIVSRDYDGAFNALVNQFEYYNCNYTELGKYAAFYEITRGL
jgi:hypothetical protein